MATATRAMTTEEFLDLPDDGVERDLIRGEVREFSPEEKMTTRSYSHSYVMANLARLLGNWSVAQGRPRGTVVVGEARVRIARDPDTTVGVDVAYLAPEQASRTDADARCVDGPPALAIEIWSPSDTHEGMVETLRDYLDAGVPQVWIVDPGLRIVTVCRSGRSPRPFNDEQEIAGDPELPGFRVQVAEIFEP